MRISAGAIWIAFVLVSGKQPGFCQDKIPLVDIKSADSSIVVDLRYATSNNISGHPIYPGKMRAFVRPELVPRLRAAQKFLRGFDYKLKIWDAYRTQSAQKELWRAVRNDSYVANPDIAAGSMHRWGVAVDCTLTDLYDRPVRMPTDFDDFTPQAMSRYLGPDPTIRSHLNLLQVAMAASGFYAFYREWWHFSAKDWAKYLPPEEAKRVAEIFGSPSKEKL
jgi:zinc D-Ala-D-Ala dipeptidase